MVRGVIANIGNSVKCGIFANNCIFDKTGKRAYDGDMTQYEILQALKNNEPFKGLGNVRVANAIVQPGGAPSGFDAKFELEFGDTRIEVYAEIKNTCTPKQVAQIVPWLSRLKAAQKDAAFALVCPGISPQSQRLCLESNVDFIDLAGNVFINVPGKVLLQRVGMGPRKESSPSFYRNPFSGKSSRILRVLLQERKAWTLSEIVEKLATASRATPYSNVSFEVSFALASRVVPQSVDRGAERVAGLGGRWRARACSLVGWAIERSLVGVEEIAPAR